MLFRSHGLGIVGLGQVHAKPSLLSVRTWISPQVGHLAAGQGEAPLQEVGEEGEEGGEEEVDRGHRQVDLHGAEGGGDDALAGEGVYNLPGFFRR